MLASPPAHPRPPQDITACESEATKKGVQVGAAQKQLEKLGKEGAKSQAEKEKLEAQRDDTMKARCPCCPCCPCRLQRRMHAVGGRTAAWCAAACSCPCKWQC